MRAFEASSVIFAAGMVRLVPVATGQLAFVWLYAVPMVPVLSVFVPQGWGGPDKAVRPTVSSNFLLGRPHSHCDE